MSRFFPVLSDLPVSARSRVTDDWYLLDERGIKTAHKVCAFCWGVEGLDVPSHAPKCERPKDPDTVAPQRRHLNLAQLAQAIAAERGHDVAIVILAKRGGYIPFTTLHYGRTDGLEDVELRSILDSLQAGMQHKMQPTVIEETCRDGKVHG